MWHFLKTFWARFWWFPGEVKFRRNLLWYQHDCLKIAPEEGESGVFRDVILFQVPKHFEYSSPRSGPLRTDTTYLFSVLFVEAFRGYVFDKAIYDIYLISVNNRAATLAEIEVLMLLDVRPIQKYPTGALLIHITPENYTRQDTGGLSWRSEVIIRYAQQTLLDLGFV